MGIWDFPHRLSILLIHSWYEKEALEAVTGLPCPWIFKRWMSRYRARLWKTSKSRGLLPSVHQLHVRDLRAQIHYFLTEEQSANDTTHQVKICKKEGWCDRYWLDIHAVNYISMIFHRPRNRGQLKTKWSLALRILLRFRAAVFPSWSFKKLGRFLHGEAI